jgi:hypothetical protein
MSESDRLSGRLVQTYSYTVPASPGQASPDRHRGEGTEPNPRDDAPAGGGWQPAVWGESGVNVLPGDEAAALINSHKGSDSHRGGKDGRRLNTRSVQVRNRDSLNGGDSAGLLLGAGGAANGGLRAEGSAPWMNPGASRRRADGGVVTRVAGFLLGHRHVPVTGEHRQGLHMNKPTVRGVRQKIITTGTGPLVRPVGPVIPKAHAQLPGVTYNTADTAPTRQAGPVGSEWAL